MKLDYIGAIIVILGAIWILDGINDQKTFLMRFLLTLLAVIVYLIFKKYFVLKK